MERVPSWLMWNLPLSVIWMPSCCTIERQKLCQSTQKASPTPAFSLLSKPRDGCDERMWPPDVSIALPEKPERSPRTPVPDGTHGEEVPALLLPLAQPRNSPEGTDTPQTPHRHPTLSGCLEQVPDPDALTEVSWHKIKSKCFQF